MPFPITLEEIERAYQETGCVPAEGDFICTDYGDKIPRACPLGAVLVCRKGIAWLESSANDDDVFGDVGAVLGLHPDVVRAFTIGVDGIPRVHEDYYGDRSLWEAYRAGVAARERFIVPPSTQSILIDERRSL